MEDYRNQSKADSDIQDCTLGVRYVRLRVCWAKRSGVTLSSKFTAKANSG